MGVTFYGYTFGPFELNGEKREGYRIVEGAPFVEIGHGNLRDVFAMLGIEGTSEDLYNHEPMLVGDFMAHAVAGLATVRQLVGLDAGKPAVELAPNFIDCGRREGYLLDKVRDLVSFAAWAQVAGADFVGWG